MQIIKSSYLVAEIKSYSEIYTCIDSIFYTLKLSPIHHLHEQFGAKESVHLKSSRNIILLQKYMYFSVEKIVSVRKIEVIMS